MSNKFIVITSIHYPSEAIRRFSEFSDWQLLVVADLKTPQDWQFDFDNVKILTVEEQKKLPLETAKLLPWNHYARKNLGYLYAMMQGAEVIYETDDDNIPYEFWAKAFPLESGADSRIYTEPSQFINAYLHFCDENVWPRGFPLSEVLNQSRDVKTELATVSRVEAPVLQGLADLEPDVDAIYRLTVGQPIRFSQSDPLFVGSQSYCPFNSQNTLWYPEAFQYLFLPAFVPSRVTDIWRGYIAQRCLHLNNQGVLFFRPSVYQERNYHNLLHDFAEEIALYTKTESLVRALEDYDSNPSGVIKFLADQSFFNLEEVTLFDAWLQDLSRLGVSLA
jgi:STELLO glycosyltransferases